MTDMESSNYDNANEEMRRRRIQDHKDGLPKYSTFDGKVPMKVGDEVMEVPLAENYSAEHFDFIVFYADRDEEKAMIFFDKLQKWGEKNDISGITYKAHGKLGWLSGEFNRTDEAIKRSTLMLFFVTENFASFDSYFAKCKDLKTIHKHKDSCLYKAVNDEDKYECLVPVFTKPKREFETLPYGIEELYGIEPGSRFFEEQLSGIFTPTKKAMKKQRMQEQQRKFDIWVPDKAAELIKKRNIDSSGTNGCDNSQTHYSGQLDSNISMDGTQSMSDADEQVVPENIVCQPESTAGQSMSSLSLDGDENIICQPEEFDDDEDRGDELQNPEGESEKGDYEINQDPMQTITNNAFPHRNTPVVTGNMQGGLVCQVASKSPMFDEPAQDPSLSESSSSEIQARDLGGGGGLDSRLEEDCQDQVRPQVTHDRKVSVTQPSRDQCNHCMQATDDANEEQTCLTVEAPQGPISLSRLETSITDVPKEGTPL